MHPLRRELNIDPVSLSLPLTLSLNALACFSCEAERAVLSICIALHLYLASLEAVSAECVSKRGHWLFAQGPGCIFALGAQKLFPGSIQRRELFMD